MRRGGSSFLSLLLLFAAVLFLSVVIEAQQSRRGSFRDGPRKAQQSDADVEEFLKANGDDGNAEADDDEEEGSASASFLSSSSNVF